MNGFFSTIRYYSAKCDSAFFVHLSIVSALAKPDELVIDAEHSSETSGAVKHPANEKMSRWIKVGEKGRAAVNAAVDFLPFYPIRFRCRLHVARAIRICMYERVDQSCMNYDVYRAHP